jgi:hypothetical protein
VQEGNILASKDAHDELDRSLMGILVGFAIADELGASTLEMKRWRTVTCKAQTTITVIRTASPRKFGRSVERIRTGQAGC